MDAIREDDMENMRQTLFAAGNLTQPYHSINTDVNKRIRYLSKRLSSTESRAGAGPNRHRDVRVE